MNTQLECIPCSLNSCMRLVESGMIPPERQEELVRSLLEMKHDNLYFLLVTKCDLIAARIGTLKGGFVVKKA